MQITDSKIVIEGAAGSVVIDANLGGAWFTPKGPSEGYRGVCLIFGGVAAKHGAYLGFYDGRKQPDASSACDLALVARADGTQAIQFRDGDGNLKTLTLADLCECCAAKG